MVRGICGRGIERRLVDDGRKHYWDQHPWRRRGRRSEGQSSKHFDQRPLGLQFHRQPGDSRCVRRGGATTVDASTLQLSGTGRISTFAGGSGNAGAIAVTADAIGLSGSGAQIVSESSGSGRGGAITVRCGTLTLEAAGKIFSRGTGGGVGGAIDIQGASVSMIGPDSSVSGDGGAPDTGVNVKADTLLLDNSASISTEAFTSNATGGAIRVNAGTVRLDNGSEITSATIASGPAGPISIEAKSMSVGSGCSVRANSFSSGAGGTVSVKADQLTLAGGDLDSAASGGSLGSPDPGPGGDINVVAGTLRITDGGLISSSTINSGDGGKVSITANRLFMSGAASGVRSPTAVASQGADFFGDVINFSNPTSGKGGDISITAGQITMRDGASITSSAVNIDPAALSTGTTGSAGAISIDAGRLSMASTSPDLQTTISSRTTLLNAGTGSAGSINVRTAQLVMKQSLINVSTSGAGTAGGIQISSGNARLRKSRRDRDEHRFGRRWQRCDPGGRPACDYPWRQCPGISRHFDRWGSFSGAGTDLLIDRGTLTAASNSTGGNIDLVAGRHVNVLESTINARAGGNGGHINIDPPAITLRNSTIDARSNGHPVRVMIQGSLLRDRSFILTDAPQAFPTVDLAGSLLALPATVPGSVRPLPDVCGFKLAARREQLHRKWPRRNSSRTGRVVTRRSRPAPTHRPADPHARIRMESSGCAVILRERRPTALGSCNTRS